MNLASPFALMLSFTLWHLSAAEPELIGADKIISELVNAPPKAAEAKDMLGDDLRAAVKDPAAITAARWLDWFDRSEKTKSSELSSVMSVLPGPDHWPALNDGLVARANATTTTPERSAMIRLLTTTLGGDASARVAALTESIKTALAIKDVTVRESICGNLRDFTTSVLASTDDRAQAQQVLGLLVLLANNVVNTSRSWQPRIDIPDLVGLVGRDAATAAIRELLLSKCSIDAEQGDATCALVREQALALVEQLKSPPWQLCCRLDALPLFLALEAKFITDDVEASKPFIDWNFPRAQRYATAAIMIKGDTAAALARLVKYQDDEAWVLKLALQDIFDPQQRVAVLATITTMLDANPSAPLWDTYTTLAIGLGQGDDVVARLRAVAAKPDLPAAARHVVDLRLFLTLLAVDQIDAALALLSGQQGKDAESSTISNRSRLQLGQALKLDDLCDRALTLMKTAAATSPDSIDASDLMRLCDVGRSADAETFAKAKLTAHLTPDADRDLTHSTYSSAQEAMILLAQIYHHAGRHADVLTLIDKAPWWDFDDFAHIHSVGSDHEKFMFAVVANALIETGRRDAARPVAMALLDQYPGNDRGYELLLRLGDSDAAVIETLDRLAARDRFEERPLIWKAVVQMRGGHADEALLSARDAIAIDPSDGEQGRGDRMRAYAVAAEALAATGDADTAAIYRGAVSAIRQAEDADVLMEAGLTTRAVAMYQQALTAFADAYCIQSRLAKDLAQLGRNEEAAEHYRKAFTLMPESFGRMESHCFGCEGVFAEQAAQVIAEDVFIHLQTTKPTPQVAYLLGYLRYEQQRWAEAADSFRAAVKLDPDYLNAHLKLLEINQHLRLSIVERQATTLALLRLDSLRRHIGNMSEHVVDIAAWWRALAIADAQKTPAPTTLYPLAAAAERLRKEAEQESSRDRSFSPQSEQSAPDVDSPSATIADHPLLKPIVSALEHLR